MSHYIIFTGKLLILNVRRKLFLIKGVELSGAYVEVTIMKGQELLPNLPR